MSKTIGFIGGGNMGGAIMAGLVKTGTFQPENIIAYDVVQAALDKLNAEIGVRTTGSLETLAEESDIIVLAVKPQILPGVLEQYGEKITKDKLVISIAAGITLSRLTGLLSGEHKIVRVMPNTPAMVGEGMTAACPNELVTEEEMACVLHILNSFGKTEVVPEHMIDAVVAVSGSSPAYVYMMIEAMADAAVAEGMPRAQAYKFAAQAVYGSAKMVLETGKHPGELKDMVCSPAGTTIQAVRVLEEKGFRSSLMEAMSACADKSRSL